MDFRQDIIEIGRDILDRDLTEEEIDELEEAMNGRYEMYLEDYYDEDEPEAVDDLFNEDFYDGLKENMYEMGLLKENLEM